MPEAADALGATGDGEHPVYFADTGEATDHPVVFFGGLGTSARAWALTDLAAPGERARRGLRIISVQRNGFAETPFDPGAGFAEAVDDVLAVLADLAIERFSVVAISGGGPYAARLLARVPERVVSVHLAAAAAGGELIRRGAAGRLDLDQIVADPAAFWDYPPYSGVHAIAGFVAAAHEEGRRALGEHTRAGAALAHELTLLGSAPLPLLTELTAPAWLYWGAEDELVGLEHARAWQATLGGPTVLRVHGGLGHDVQYLRWAEILDDLAWAAER